MGREDPAKDGETASKATNARAAHAADRRYGAEAVLFDLDGTLIDTKKLYLECYRRAVVPAMGRELGPAQLLALRPRSEVRFIRTLVGEARLDECMAAFYQEYERLHDSHFDGIYPGVPEMLRALREAGLPIGIVTGKSRRSWDITCARVGLGPLDVLVFDDDVRDCKPDPHGLEIALEYLGVAPEAAIYVGDTGSDLDAASAAGVLPAAALWARKDPEHRARFLERARARGAPAFESPAEVARRVIGRRTMPA